MRSRGLDALLAVTSICSHLATFHQRCRFCKLLLICLPSAYFCMMLFLLRRYGRELEEVSRDPCGRGGDTSKLLKHLDACVCCCLRHLQCLLAVILLVYSALCIRGSSEGFRGGFVDSAGCFSNNLGASSTDWHAADS